MTDKLALVFYVFNRDYETEYSKYVPLIDEAFLRLTEQEQQVLKKRFDRPTYDEIAHSLMISQTRVRQVLWKGLGRLKYIFEGRTCPSKKSYLLSELLDKSADELKEIQINELPELSTRVRNCLKKVGIKTIGDLVLKTGNELLTIYSFGKGCLSEVQGFLGKMNLGLEEEQLNEVLSEENSFDRFTK